MALRAVGLLFLYLETGQPFRGIIVGGVSSGIIPAVRRDEKCLRKSNIVSLEREGLGKGIGKWGVIEGWDLVTWEVRVERRREWMRWRKIQG